MKIIKTIVISAILAVPMLASAATTTIGALGSGSTLAASGYDALGNGGSFVNLAVNDSINDTWTLTVGSGYMADIAFKNNDLSVSGFKIWDINNFAVTPAASLTGLTGTHTFAVSGTASGIAGGAYSVGTVVSAVPVPAAAWLMGSALIGAVSFGRRKVQAA